ncbi:MAG: glycosyltransferase [Candidatus Abyssobacteria bacterium SURF_5]|jgi:glycosyltransferase involved in cell wall biosynthesis|uniref:Glycosyltransferase n=1 Tax=Abyssobacteria bacterium (strain SURF_5) TaxID=2093360 RepID=A0A3A4N825_ABYX5|nr:MAG: glycosyltransferase [Candidatus Abyssubacteria bacterium SURF_5]
MNGRLSQMDIAIVKHTYTPTGGAEQELLRYVLPKAKSVTYISHPFRDARDVPLNTQISMFENGELRKEISAPLFRGPFPLMAMKDIIFTVWYLKKMRRRIHLYFGVDNLNAFSGIVLRRLGVVDRVVYYVIDYAPDRFRRPFMQSLYRRLDRWCCYDADAVWNVSAAMEDARKAHGFDSGRSAPQIEVPLGNWYDESPKTSPNGSDNGLIVFLGTLAREQGLNLVIEALPKIRKRIPNARLRVIGSGPEMEPLKSLAHEMRVADSVEFLGFIQDGAKAAALLAEGAVAVAPYLYGDNIFKRFADPGKVKLYLAAGLPVVISRVPPVAELIERSGAGIAVEPAVNEIGSALENLLLSPGKISAMRENALELGKKFDWIGIFDRAFGRTFECWVVQNN